MSFPKPFHPEILYAERSSDSDPEKNIIYFTINTPDIQGEPNLDITEDQISFSAKSGNPEKGIPEKEWAFDLDLWGKIVPSETKKAISSRAVVLVLRKKDLRAEYWPRLTKEKPNRNWIKTDFAKWVDEDEQDGELPEVPDMGGMGGMGGGMPDMSELMAGMGGMGGGMPGMPGMGGAGGMGGMDFSKLMEQMGGAGGMPDLGGDDDVDDESPAAAADKADKPAAKKADEPEVEEVE